MSGAPAVAIVPTVGRIVLYCLDAGDADAINRRRTNGGDIALRMTNGQWPRGAQAHIGNQVYPGDVYPGMVVKVWSEDLISIRVMLDGTDDFWATSKHVSEEPTPGFFHWMPYQKQVAKA